MQQVQHSSLPTFCVATQLVALASAPTESCRPFIYLPRGRHPHSGEPQWILEGASCFTAWWRSLRMQHTSACIERSALPVCNKDCCVAARMKQFFLSPTSALRCSR